MTQDTVTITPVTITEAELFAEIERLAERTNPSMNRKQFTILRHGRTLGVPWGDLTSWYNEKFGTTFSTNELRSKYHRVKERHVS